MNTPFFLANRLAARGNRSFSRTFVVISIASIALGLAIMFIAVAILTGFKKEIREKVTGFTGHVVVKGFSEAGSFETRPVDKRQRFYYQLRHHPDVSHIQVTASKAGIIKAKEHIQGVILKGTGQDQRWDFFSQRLTEGTIPRFSDTVPSDQVLISKKLCTLLNLKLHDDIRMYFIHGESTQGRKFRIAGIYDTGLEEFDKMFVLCDIRQIQRLNKWTSNQVGGFEIFLRQFEDVDRMGAYIYHQIGFELDASTVRMFYPQIFDWLDLQDINVLIILILVILVSATTIISTLLILILERTRMIGILKALGMRDTGIMKLFLYNALYIVGWGMLWGNLLAFTLCLLQQQFSLITLSEETYFMPVIPVNLDLWNIVAINAGTVAVCYLIFMIPVWIIARITPVRAIRFS